MKEKTSIVIPVFNEEDTIQNVVKSCCELNKESEIIVVDDGSEDNTHQHLADMKQELSFIHLSLPENKGKSNAMVKGVEKASREIILFFDADVTGIRAEHFDKLLDPLAREEPEADMVLGLPSETLIDHKLSPFNSLTGERALFRKDLLPILDDIRDIRFGVETYLNLYYQAHGKKIKYTLLEGLIHPTKYGKTSPTEATKEFILAGWQIAEVMLKNYDLISKRIANTFDEQGGKVKKSLKQLQEEINERIQFILRNNG
jgi:glycosyltransferase involved in cell wall biosynthesis